MPGVAAGIDYGFRLDDGELLPDPRSPRQPFGINGPEPHLRPLGVQLDRPELARRAAARVGDLRAARRHVHPRGDVRRGHRPAGSPAPARRAHRRADAGRGVPRPARLGLRRDQPVGGARAVRRPGRAEAVRGRLPRARPGRPLGRGVQPRRRRQPARRLRAVLHHRARDPVGTRGEPGPARVGRGPRVPDRQRADVAARLPPGRAAAGRGARAGRPPGAELPGRARGARCWRSPRC